MGERMFIRVEAFFRRLNTGYYTYLLLFLLLVFAFRPQEKGFIYLSIWKSCFTLTVLTAIFNVKHHRGVKLAAMIMAVPVFILSWAEIVFSLQHLFVFNMISTIAFLGICTASILYDVILYAKVTAETLRGVVCAYFLIAFLFAYIYYLVEYLMPGSFHLIDMGAATGASSHNA